MIFDDRGGTVRPVRDMLSRPGARFVGDSGFVLAMTAMLLIPLTVSTAFATDLGSWYAQGTRMQRAADSAALAGVVWLPDQATAITVATQVAAQNGYTNGVGGFSVSVTRAGDQRLKVDITGPAQLFFGKTVLQNKSLTRSATGEYILAVPMGSPKNFLGTGNLISAANGWSASNETNNKENVWLAISGQCASREQGERIMAKTDANWTGTGGSYQTCTGGNTVPNPEFDANGYFYVMDLAADHAGPVYLEVYDAAICGGTAPTGESPTNYGGQGFKINYKVRDKDNTSFNVLDNPVLNSFDADPVNNCPGGVNNLQNRWRTMWVFNNPTAGQYYLQVSDNNANPDLDRNTNQFSIRARFDGPATAIGNSLAPAVFGLCSTEPGSTTPPVTPDCPQIHGYQSMGYYMKDNAAQSKFYLADIGTQHSGKTLVISLWDIGEGAASLELLNPLGATVNFSWSADNCPPDPAPSGGCSGGPTALLDVSGTGTQPGPNRISNSKYNDRSMTITYQLPGNIATAYGGKTWWRVQYTGGATGSISDRTTWSVSIKGDPVHLVA